MRLISVNLKRHVTAIACTVLLSGMVSAEPVPPELLQKLRNASAVDAPRVAHEVETIWARSGSAAMDLLLKRGRDALEEGAFRVAIDHLTALTDHAPDFAEGYNARAEAYFRTDLYGPAMDDLEMALALNPENYNAIFGVAVMLHEFGNLDRAARMYRQVLALHPHHEHAQAALDRLRKDGIGREL